MSVDPLADAFPSWNPYNYTLNNPVRYTDPTGMATEESPIYGEDGEFLGVDSEGFTGDVLVMNKDLYNRLSDNNTKTVDHDFAAFLTENTTQVNFLNEAGLSIEQYANVLTHVVKQLEGEKFEGTTIDFGRLNGGKIQMTDGFVDDDGFLMRRLHGSADNPSSQHGSARTLENGNINVTAVTYYGTNFDFNRVENIQNILGIHEYVGHGLKNLGMDRHRSVYQLQSRHWTFKNTTPSLKATVNEFSK